MAGVVFFVAVAAADFFAGFDFPVCLVDFPAAFVDLFVVVAFADFVAFFFYPFFRGYANLHVPQHLQIPVQLPVVLTKSIQQLPVLPG